MNPLFMQWGGVLVRMLLSTSGASMVTAWLIRHGFLTASQLDELTVGLVLLVATAGWGFWQKHRALVLQFTGLAMAKGTTLEEVKQTVAAGVAAPAGTGADDTPVLVKSVDVHKIRSFVLPFLLAAGLVAGCSSLGGVVKPNPTPDNTQAVMDQAASIAVATKSAAKLANQLRDDAQKLYDTKVISAATMQRINNAGNKASQKGLEFVSFAETVTTDPSLRVTAKALLDVFQEFIDAVSPAGLSGADIRKALNVLFAYLGVE